MKNKIGFIPKTWEVQPDYYKQIFRNWIAVFLVDDGSTMGIEYHLELESNGFYHPENADIVRLLRQDKDCRRFINAERFKSIKQAYKALLPNLLKKVIKDLAEEKGYPHRKLNHEEYSNVLKTAHKTCFQ